MSKDLLKIFAEQVVWVGVAAILIFLFVVTGCAPQHRRPIAQQPSASVPSPDTRVQLPPALVPSPEPVWQPVIEHVPTSQSVKTPRRMETMGPGGKTIFFEAGKKYVLTCPETGTLTIKFPAGEKIQKFGSGASGEWMIELSTMGLDLPIDVLTIDRTPFAPQAEMYAITDTDVYQFILIPQATGVSKQHASVFIMVNPETEARRAEWQSERAEVIAQQRREAAERIPQLSADQLRLYQIGGDYVAWRPTQVVGDDKRTIIQLPPSTGAAIPTLTVITDGKEMRVNSRTIDEGNGKGPKIIVDQSFTEARLIGADGTVSIIGGR